MATSTRGNGTRAPVEKASVPVMAELGTTGLRHQGGYIQEEWLKALDSWRGVRTYQEMGLDPVVGAMLAGIISKLRRVEWNVEPADETAEADKIAEFVEQCMDDMSQTWEDFLSEALTMLQYGWSYHEIVYKVRRGEVPNKPGASSVFDDGWVGWRKLPIRSQDTLQRWEMDGEGGISGMWQLDMSAFTEVFIPIEKSALFRPSAHKNNPQGMSVLRSAYIPWLLKKRAQEAESIGIDRDMVGIPKFGLPAEWMGPAATSSQKEAVEEYKRIGEQMRNDESACLVMPAVYDALGNPLITFELITAPGQKVYDVGAVIRRYNQEITMTAQADVILVGHEGTGSYSLAQEKMRAFAEGLEAWLKAVASVMNLHAIPRLLKLNKVAPELAPKLMPGEVDQQDLEMLGKWITALAGAGYPMFPDEELEPWLARAAGMPYTPRDERPEPPVPPILPGAAPAVPGADPANPAPSAPAKPKAQGKPEDKPLETQTAKGDRETVPFDPKFNALAGMASDGSTPGPAGDDGLDGGVGYAVLGAEGLQGDLARDVAGSDLSHLGSGELGEVASFAEGGAALAGHVPGVVGGGAQEQMGDVVTGGDVASVADHHPGWDGSVGFSPSQSMDVVGLPGKSATAVSADGGAGPEGAGSHSSIDKYNSAHDARGRFGTGGTSASGQLAPVMPGAAKTPGAATEVSMDGLDPKVQKAVNASWTKATGVSPAQGKKNLQGVFDEAMTNPATAEAGRRWYGDAHEDSARLAKKHGVPLDTAAGVTAALSPGMRWEQNREYADHILSSAGKHKGLDAERLAHVAKTEHKMGTPHGYDPLIKASRIAQGEPPGSVLTGAKVRSFYNNIRDPKDPNHVTIDTHMLDAMYGGTRKGPGGILIETPRSKVVDQMAKKGYTAELPKGWKAQTPAGADFVARNPVFSALTGSPSSAGRTIGTLPLAADNIRSIADRHNAAHPADRLVPNQVQAIIWTHTINVHPPIESRQATNAAIEATAEFYGSQQ